MAISKTDFINYTRCPRYYHLEELRKDKLTSKLTKEEYLKENEDESIKVILETIFDEYEADTTEKIDIQLNALRDYYTQVEILAGSLVQKIFNGTSHFGSSLDDQISYDYDLNGIRYMCYCDIVNEINNDVNIIEVKATSSRDFLSLNYKKEPFFVMENGIYKINKELDLKAKENIMMKLYNRFGHGKYVYDLSVQRYFIEGQNGKLGDTKNYNYYLAVLNHEYVYDGTVVDGKCVYNADKNGNEIICIFDMNEITENMMKIIDQDREILENVIFNGSSLPCKVGISCGLKKNTVCKYKSVCFKNVPEKNASYNYINFRMFKDLNGCKYDKYDLVNDGYFKLDDVPLEWLKSKNHILQRDCYDRNVTYVNKEKLKAGLSTLKYPIYHLDFETFPCPLPRFKGEKCYTQSPFEFSLHIEREPGVCDKEKDNYVFMATSLKDERLELVKMLTDLIDIDKGGCMLAQNVSFENSRIKELAEIFPEYKEKLLKIRDNSTDLLYLLNTQKEMYKSLGYNEEDASVFNYYNNKQSGSYSIKKTLPLFSDLTYSTLDIKNGTEALVEYSKFDLMTKDEVENARRNLIIYCQQDTWAMVEILKGLRELVK